MSKLAKYLFCVPLLLWACSDESPTLAGADASDDTAIDTGSDTIADPDSDTDGGCAPRTDGTCESLGIHLCCELRGKAYRWDVENQCKVEIGPPAGEPVLCLEGASLKGPQVACVTYSAEACYSRTNSDGTMTVYLTGYDLGSDFFEGTGLVKCDSLFESTVRAALPC